MKLLLCIVKSLFFFFFCGIKHRTAALSCTVIKSKSNQTTKTTTKSQAINQSFPGVANSYWFGVCFAWLEAFFFFWFVVFGDLLFAWFGFFWCLLFLHAILNVLERTLAPENFAFKEIWFCASASIRCLYSRSISSNKQKHHVLF